MQGDNDHQQHDVVLVTDDEAFAEAITVLFVLDQLSITVYRSSEALANLRAIHSGCVIVHGEADGVALRHFEDWHKPSLAVILISSSLPADLVSASALVLRPPLKSEELVRVVRDACGRQKPDFGASEDS